eukprot:13055645-Ditylum_brightwellii.AAC.1
MQQLQKVEKDITIGEANGKDSWQTTRELPIGNSFNEKFLVKQELRNDKDRIIMHAKINSTL